MKTKSGLKKIVKFQPAFYKVHSDPKKNYGVGCVKCMMVLVGDKGAVSFVFGTGMHLPKTYDHWLSKGVHTDPYKPDYMGYDVSYHSPVPMGEYHKKPSQKKCDWINKPCYCDGSAMYADEVMTILLEKGDEAVWKALEDYYNSTFK